MLNKLDDNSLFKGGFFKFFDSSLKFFRVRACIYSYNKTLKKKKSLVFLDFGLKEKSSESFYSVYTIFDEAVKDEVLPSNRFHNHLFFASLGLDCKDSKKIKLRDYFTSRYDSTLNSLNKYFDTVVDTFYSEEKLSKRIFFKKLFDIDRSVSDFYPISLNLYQRQIIIIRDFASH
jgi:hypothetical protein